MRATIIHNPKAGRRNVSHMLPAVCSALAKEGWRVKICSAGAGHNMDLRTLARKECEDSIDAIFVAGGDGSVGAVANVISGTDVALGVLPCGTGNVWARGLGLTAPEYPWSRGLVAAAVRQATGCVRGVDLGVCNDRLFLLWAGIGLDGHIVHGIEPRGTVARKLGLWHYIPRGLVLSIGWRGASVRIRSGSDYFGGRILCAVATNVPLYAGGLAMLDSGARAQRGSLTLTAFRGDGFVDSCTQMGGLLAGRHVDSRNVEFSVGRRFVVKSDRELPLQVDGEPDGASRQFEIGVASNTLRVFVPESLGESAWHRFWS